MHIRKQAIRDLYEAAVQARIGLKTVAEVFGVTTVGFYLWRDETDHRTPRLGDATLALKLTDWIRKQVSDGVLPRKDVPYAESKRLATEDFKQYVSQTYADYLNS